MGAVWCPSALVPHPSEAVRALSRSDEVAMEGGNTFDGELE